MSFWMLLAIAVGLGMDAFAVAIGTGVKLCRVSFKQIFRMSAAFGLFQFFMPILGWLAGQAFVDVMQKWDHWIAFILLVVVGGHMLWGGIFEQEKQAEKPSDPTQGMTLLVLAVATSIDALAIGLSFSMLNIVVWGPAVLIGVVAVMMTFVGMKIGCKVGMILGKRMEIAGGLILVGIGIKILFDHLL